MSKKHAQGITSPLIGVTIDHDSGKQVTPRARGEGTYYLSESYAWAIEQVGGVPVLLPYIAQKSKVKLLLENLLDGLVVTGGGFDVDPMMYGEKPIINRSRLRPERTEFETLAIKSALKLKMPVLAICGGMQLLNVVQGGTLYQYIPEQLPDALNHMQKQPSNKATHFVDIEKGSRLYSIYRTDRMKVNSTHRQSVKDVGKGLALTATSPDSVVEAIELIGDAFCMGLQWHPEVLGFKRGKNGFELGPLGKKIFNAFIRAAKDYKLKGA